MDVALVLDIATICESLIIPASIHAYWCAPEDLITKVTPILIELQHKRTSLLL